MVSPRLFACRAISRTEVDSQTDPRSGWPMAKSRCEPLPPVAGDTASVRGSTSMPRPVGVAPGQPAVEQRAHQRIAAGRPVGAVPEAVDDAVGLEPRGRPPGR